MSFKRFLYPIIGPFKDGTKASEGDMLRRTVYFAAFNALIAALYLPEIRMVLGERLRAELYPHMLVPAVSAYFILGERKRIFSGPSYGYFQGLAFIIAVLSVHIFGSNLGIGRSENDFLSVTALSAVLLWYGGFVFFYGAGAFTAARFPLYFLLFTVPPPEALIEWLAEPLGAGSMDSAWAMLSLSGIPVENYWPFFGLSGLTVEAAMEFSAVRSNLTLVIASIAAGRLYLSTWVGRFSLAALSVPVAVLKNGLWIAALALSGSYEEGGVLQGPVHGRGEFPFFLLALAVIGAIVFLFNRVERRLVKNTGAAF